MFTKYFNNLFLVRITGVITLGIFLSSFQLSAADIKYYYRLKEGPVIPITWPKEDSDRNTKVSVESIGPNKFRLRITDWNLKTGKMAGDYIWVLSAENFPANKVLYPNQEFTVDLKAEAKKCQGHKLCKGGAALMFGDAGTFVVLGVNPPKPRTRKLQDSCYVTVNKKNRLFSRSCRIRVPDEGADKIWISFVNNNGRPFLRSEWEKIEGSLKDQDKAEQAAKYAQEAQEAYSRKDWADMEAGYRNALTLTPNNALYWNELGTALWQQGKYREAEAAHRESIKINPNVGLYHANLAGVLWKLGNVQAARTEAKIAIRLGFRNHWIFEKLGLRP